MRKPPSQIIGIVRASGRAVALALIGTYRAIMSPILAAAIGPACRFEPTCSEYAYDAIGRHGILRGGWMTIKRLARCRPGGGWGYDPAPPGGARCRT